MPASNGRQRIGLALGGGAIRGFAHLGVLSVLEQENIPVDVIAGTSVGALIGAFYSAGVPLCELERISEEMSWYKVSRPVWSRDGLISFAKMEEWIVSFLGDLYFEDLALPFAAVATDVATGEAVIMNKGPLAPAIRASCSVPGLVTPVPWNGRLLCDGGVSNNLPVSVARQMGADYVIAVDIFEQGHHPFLGPLGRGVAALETAVKHAGGGYDQADCLISPNLAGQSYIRFSKRVDFISRGRQTAEAKIAGVKDKLLARLEQLA